MTTEELVHSASRLARGSRLADSQDRIRLSFVCAQHGIAYEVGDPWDAAVSAIARGLPDVARAELDSQTDDESGSPTFQVVAWLAPELVLERLPRPGLRRWRIQGVQLGAFVEPDHALVLLDELTVPTFRDEALGELVLRQDTWPIVESVWREAIARRPIEWTLALKEAWVRLLARDDPEDAAWELDGVVRTRGWTELWAAPLSVLRRWAAVDPAAADAFLADSPTYHEHWAAWAFCALQGRRLLPMGQERLEQAMDQLVPAASEAGTRLVGLAAAMADPDLATRVLETVERVYLAHDNESRLGWHLRRADPDTVDAFVRLIADHVSPAAADLVRLRAWGGLPPFHPPEAGPP